jgi:hypothetical protein
MSTASSRGCDLSERQRWLAARRLAAGDPLVLAAASAGINPHALRLVLHEDPDFIALVDASRAIKALSREEKRARLEDLCWDGAERAILDGRVSTLNLCVKSLKLIASSDAEENESESDGMQDLLDRMTDEEYAEYLSLGDEKELEEAAEPASSRPDRSREPAAPTAAVTSEQVAEPAAPATPVPVPLLVPPMGTAACAYGPAGLELPCPPGKDLTAQVATLDWLYGEPAGLPPVIEAAVRWQKPAGSGFPQRPP